MEAIGELTRGKTLVTIAHRLNTVRNAGQILVVDAGRIVQRGTHDELMREDGDLPPLHPHARRGGRLEAGGVNR